MWNAVALAVGREARHQEAGEAALGLGEDEEGVAHRRRAEPLVAGELVLGARPAAVQRRGDRRVGAHVGAALLLGHRHPAQRARSCRRPGAARAVVVERGEARLPLGGELGLLAQRRDHRVGHRDRAADPGLGLRRRMNIAARATWAPGCGSRHGSAWRPWPTPAPISSCQAGWNSTSSMRLPKRSWVLQLRRVLVRLEAPSGSPAPSRQNAPTSRDPVLGPVAALAAQRLDQHPVGGEGVVVLERGRLVGDLVGCGGAGVLKR